LANPAKWDKIPRHDRITLSKVRHLGRSEYLLVGGLLLAGAIAFPLVKDVYMVQSIFLAICGGLGIQ
jgi:hypothetical protein